MTTDALTPAPGDPHDELRAKVGRYFDGELEPAEEDAVLDHLADCELCQAELGDVVGVHVAMTMPRDRAPRDAAPIAREPANDVVPITRARPGDRRRGIAVAGGAMVAAAILLLVLWPRRAAPPGGAMLALAPERAIEARFEQGPFAAHRPYAVVRGERPRESIPLTTLAELERTGDKPVLVAALAASGDLARAREIAAQSPLSPVDRAALALTAGGYEEAFGLLDGHATTPAAKWNLALAARGLGLPALAHRYFAEVARAGEPGWRDEAARQVGALDATLAARDATRDLLTRARAMLAGTGPAITPADALQLPGLARAYYYDALRIAGDRDAALVLAPIADVLDRATGTSHARAALDRVAAASFAVRAQFRADYALLATQQLDRPRTAALLDRLRREKQRTGSRDVDDILVGALIWARQTRGRLAELEALIAPDRDPWFDLLALHERLAAERAARGDAVIIDRVRAAADGCPAVWTLRCGELAIAAAEVLTSVGRDDEALEYARRASAHLAAAKVPSREDRALAYLAEQARYRDRRALARAMFEEVELRSAAECRFAHYARTGRAKLALIDGRLDEARSLVPGESSGINACGQPPDSVAITIAVDLARTTGSAADRSAADRWLAAARASGEPPLVALAGAGAGVLAIAADPTADRPLRDWLAAHPGGDAETLEVRAWAIGALADAAGRRGDWAAVASAALAEIAAPLPAGCIVAASVDGDRQVAAVRDPAGRWLGRGVRAPIGELLPSAVIPDELTRALAGCAKIDVIARPPLHGATALLPPNLPWAFVSGPVRPRSAMPRRTVIVTDAVPPEASLQLPVLPPAAVPDGAVIVRGSAATPARVLNELGTATYLEINAHGVADIAAADASFLALSPEPSGRFMLTAGDVREATFGERRTKQALGSPVVVLAACRSARLAPYLHRRWSLPDAFLAAGARAVIATDIDVPDASAGPVFGELRARIEAGESPAAAVAAVRTAAVVKDPRSWIARIAVFE